MAKEISFSEFLKEGALQKERVPEKEITNEKPQPIRLEPDDVASETEVKEFWKRLRHFFRTGENPEKVPGIYVPALVAPYLRTGTWEMDYPYFLSPEREEGLPLEDLLIDTMSVVFSESEAILLRKNIHRLLVHFKGAFHPGTAMVTFQDARDYALGRLAKLEVHGEEGERFTADVERLAENLPKGGVLLHFHHEVPLYFLQHRLERKESARLAYKERIRSRIEELRELLKVDDQKSGERKGPEAGFDFASEMITLEKVSEMMPREGTSKMSSSRVERIKKLIEELQETLDSKENHAHLVVIEELKEEFRWKDIFTSSKFSFEDLDTAFKKVEEIFDANIVSFTNVLVAMRRAELEVHGKYEEDVHDDYFAHFKWFKLTEEELALFPPVFLITSGAHLLRDGISAFSKLISSNKPINLLALTNRTVSEVDPNVDWEDASRGFRQELSAIAISHRDAFTFQAATDQPGLLMEGLRGALRTTAPSVVQVLVPGVEDDPYVAFLKINAAADARYFPYLMYDCHRGLQWGSRFDIRHNSQPDKDWPIHPFSYQGTDGHQVEVQLPFTYADYKAMTQEKVDELFLVPESMVTDQLIPLDKYLQLPQEETTGKVPYIWLVDEHNRMHRAALPYMWAVSCQERLDFWNFIQELGGLNSYHVKRALQESRIQWELEKEKELVAMRATHERELKEVKRNAAGEALDRMVGLLLDENGFEVSSAERPKTKKEASPVPKEDEESEDPISEKVVAPAPEPEEEEMKAEAWVETFRCTSCNDCTEKFPAIFRYNEEKQAYIEDASKGTFEQLVIAAENCPASCIHPGEPLDPKEPNLDELRKRAAKFN